MSKSKGNVVDPHELVDRYGADTVRTVHAVHGPGRPGHGVAGLRARGRSGGSCNRLWRVVHEQAAKPRGRRAPTGPLARKAHATIAKVTDDIDRRFAFNTPIAAVMELVNEISRTPDDPAARFAAETAVSLIQPYAPHVAEELWQRARAASGSGSSRGPWPTRRCSSGRRSRSSCR